jgi:hypothetical protein
MPDTTASLANATQTNMGPTSQEDNWDPWEANVASQHMVVYAAPEDKGKRKSMQKPRHSSRLQ